jgi:hypothetical protein
MNLLLIFILPDSKMILKINHSIHLLNKQYGTNGKEGKLNLPWFSGDDWTNTTPLYSIDINFEIVMLRKIPMYIDILVLQKIYA